MKNYDYVSLESGASESTNKMSGKPDEISWLRPTARWSSNTNTVLLKWKKRVLIRNFQESRLEFRFSRIENRDTLRIFRRSQFAVSKKQFNFLVQNNNEGKSPLRDPSSWHSWSMSAGWPLCSPLLVDWWSVLHTHGSHRVTDTQEKR